MEFLLSNVQISCDQRQAILSSIMYHINLQNYTECELNTQLLYGTILFVKIFLMPINHQYFSPSNNLHHTVAMYVHMQKSLVLIHQQHHIRSYV